MHLVALGHFEHDFRPRDHAIGPVFTAVAQNPGLAVENGETVTAMNVARDVLVDGIASLGGVTGHPQPDGIFCTLHVGLIVEEVEIPVGRQ